MHSSFETQPSPVEREPAYRVDSFDPDRNEWEEVRHEIMQIERGCFGSKSYPSYMLCDEFENPDNVVLMLREQAGGRIVGYTYAKPWGGEFDVGRIAYVSSTALLPQIQKMGLARLLLTRLDDELRRRGYKYVSRDAAVDNGYADKLQMYYGDRVIGVQDHDSEYGPQRFLKIRL